MIIGFYFDDIYNKIEISIIFLNTNNIMELQQEEYNCSLEGEKKNNNKVVSLVKTSSNISLSVEQQSQQASAVTTQKSSKSQQVNNDSDSGEEWLHHYMLGKIKEKLNQSSIMEPLNHYLKVF